jgi:hypothetical protein
MKKINLIKMIIMITFGVIMTIIVLSSCSNQQPSGQLYNTKRVVVLENNTVSFVNIPRNLDSIYHDFDTVWVNLLTHRIDDRDTNTMMCVINPSKIVNSDIIITLADTVDDRKTYNIQFSDGTGLDSMYPEEIAQSLISGKWNYDEDLKVVHEQR